MKPIVRMGRGGLCLALMGWFWLAGAAVQPARGDNHALLVGIDHYAPTYHLNPLPSCINDARAFRSKLLTDTNRWKSYRITTLLDSAATENAIRHRLQSKAASLRSGDVFVFYQSSHGGWQPVHTRNTHLCTYASPFTDVELGRELAHFRSGVKVIVIADACRSGGLFKSEKPINWNFAENVLRAYKEARIQAGDKSKSLGANIAFLTAAEWNEIAYEGNPYSRYTKFLLEACTKPDADNNSRNGYYSFWEAHQYAKPRAYAGHPRQSPQSWNYPLLRSITMVRVQIKAPTPAAPVGSTSVRPLFSWSRVDGAKYYRLQIFNGSGRLVKDISGLRDRYWRPTSDLARGNYTWRVCGYSFANLPGPWSRKPAFSIPGYLRRITFTSVPGARSNDLVLVLCAYPNPLTHQSNYVFRCVDNEVAYAHQSRFPFADIIQSRGCGVPAHPYNLGPEVILIYPSTWNGLYKCWIDAHEAEEGTNWMAESRARVTVHSETALLRTFDIPLTGPQWWPGGPMRNGYWHVFNMDRHGTIFPVNRIVVQPP